MIEPWNDEAIISKILDIGKSPRMSELVGRLVIMKDNQEHAYCCGDVGIILHFLENEEFIIEINNKRIIVLYGSFDIYKGDK